MYCRKDKNEIKGLVTQLKEYLGGMDMEEISEWGVQIPLDSERHNISIRPQDPHASRSLKYST